MSMELIAIIGASVAIISAGTALAGLILSSQRAQRAEMQAQLQAQRAETQAQFQAQREEMQAQRAETQAQFQAMQAEMQAEFKITREAIGELRERMAHLEGLVAGLSDALLARRVAEEPAKYGTT